MKSAPSITGTRPYLRRTSTESFATSGVISLLYSRTPSFSIVAPQALIMPVNGICSRYPGTKALLLPVHSHASCPFSLSLRIASSALSGTPFSMSQMVPSASKNTAFFSVFMLFPLYVNLCKKFLCHFYEITGILYSGSLIR